jgi:spermidine dehydrogenase
MDAEITRRDFVNAIAVGAGASLLGAAAPGLRHALHAQARAKAAFDPWTGPGGIGDYARANGNTWEVVNAGHGIRDHLYEKRIAAAPATGESYDCVIVGGGFTGTMAAWRLLKDTDRKWSCLILENNLVMGGEAKRNEFLVRGQHLIGPQGSNEMVVAPGGEFRELQDDVGMPHDFEYGALPPGKKQLEFPLDNYLYQFWGDTFESHGYFFDGARPQWVRNPFGHELQGTPWSAEMRRDLLRWRRELQEKPEGDVTARRKWLDTMSYDDYLVKELKLSPEVSRFLDPILACAMGPTCNLASAMLGDFIFRGLSSPGFRLSPDGVAGGIKIFSFPGGNDGLLRLILKWLNPDAIEGSAEFAEVHNGRIRFEALDRPGIPCRMRVGATVVHVAHDPERKSQPAVVTYLKDGKLASVRARTVIWAAASWSGQYAVAHLPETYQTAMRAFPRAPMMIVNVALDNWRAFYRLGFTAASWRGGFGFTANLRKPMYVGSYRPPLDPDQPTLLTFYVPFPERGANAVEQGKMARTKLYATPYRYYEEQVRRQLTRMLGSAGFDARRDIAGIVLNRWGHAYNVAEPGFFFSRDGKPTATEILRQPLGVVTFAHSELTGHQSSPYALEEGVRAARQVQKMG